MQSEVNNTMFMYNRIVRITLYIILNMEGFMKVQTSSQTVIKAITASNEERKHVILIGLMFKGNYLIYTLNSSSYLDLVLSLLLQTKFKAGIF